MENKLVIVKSATSTPVGLKVPTHNFSRQWTGYGMTHKIPLSTLEEIYYDAGAKYLFENGYLEILDKEAKVALGLEEEGDNNEVEERVLILSPVKQNALLKKADFDEFKETVDSLKEGQIQELVKRAIDSKVSDMNKLKYLGDKAKVDLVEYIRELEREQEEDKKKAGK